MALLWYDARARKLHNATQFVSSQQKAYNDMQSLFAMLLMLWYCFAVRLGVPLSILLLVFA
jgi:hypothetical protein